MIDRLDRLHAWTIARPELRFLALATRALLAVAFLPSGWVKIAGERFTGLPQSDPVGFFFAGFFSAHGYYRFVGVAQWTAAALLLIPRTAWCGAALYLPIIANVFAITVAIGSPFGFTRLITGLMLVANLYLLWFDWDRWPLLLRTEAKPRVFEGAATAGMFFSCVLGLHGVTQAHLARLQHRPLVWPTIEVAFAAVTVLVIFVHHRRPASIRR